MSHNPVYFILIYLTCFLIEKSEEMEDILTKYYKEQYELCEKEKQQLRCNSADSNLHQLFDQVCAMLRVKSTAKRFTKFHAQENVDHMKYNSLSDGPIILKDYIHVLNEDLNSLGEKFKWVFRNGKSFEGVQRLQPVLHTLELTEDEFCDRVPIVFNFIANHINFPYLKCGNIGIDRLIKAVRSLFGNMKQTDVRQLKTMIALILESESITRESEINKVLGTSIM